MNEPHESLSDDVLNDLLTPLRDVTVPDETRSANRAAVKRALEGRIQLPWWRQTVAVPVPVAAAAMVALVVTVTAILWPSRTQPSVAQVASQPIQDQFNERGPAASSGEENMSSSSWSVTRSYIQSLGSLGSGRDNFEAEIKEKRNES
jgi:hypothetical protein